MAQNNSSDMTSSVIICTRNRPDELVSCLRSITTQTRLPDEVVIVDASDNQQLYTLLKDTLFDALPIRYIHTEPGLTRQRNVGVGMASGDIIFFFDDDVELDQEYILKIIEVYRSNPLGNVGGVQGIDLNIKEPFLEGKKRLLFHRLFFLNRRDRYAKVLPSGAVTHLDVASPDIRYSKKSIRIYCMSGAIMSYYRKVFSDFKFEENYEGYSHGEDAEFSYRVSRKYDLVFTSHARAFHNQQSDHRDWFRTEDFSRSKIRAQMLLFVKHCASNPLNYLALLWSWLGLIIWIGLIDRNKTYLRGTLRGIREVIFGDKGRG